MTRVHADSIDVDVDPLFLAFSLDFGDGVIALFFLPVILNHQYSGREDELLIALARSEVNLDESRCYER